MQPGVVSRISHRNPTNAPYLIHGNTTEWWDKLDSRFPRMEEHFKLGFSDRVKVGATAAIDTVIRTGAASMVGTFSIPRGFRPSKVREMLEHREHYETMALSGDPSRFFVTPPDNVRIERSEPQRPFFTPKGGRCVDLRFVSPFEPSIPVLRERYAAETRNMHAHARYWHHSDGPRPTIVAIHGFGADPYWLNEWFFSLPWFYELGCDILLYTLPFHGRRQMMISPHSGHGLFAQGLAWLNEAVAQGVHDFRIYLDYLLEDIGAPAAGVTGVSLGGYHSALLAAVEPRLAFAIPNVPVISLADIMMEWEPLGTFGRTLLRAIGMDLHDLREVMAVHCPLTYAPTLSKERLFIIGGVADKLAPPKHSRLLWEHWDQCDIHWFPGSHILHLDRGEYLRQMARFMGSLHFLPPRD